MILISVTLGALTMQGVPLAKWSLPSHPAPGTDSRARGRAHAWSQCLDTLVMPRACKKRRNRPNDTN